MAKKTTSAAEKARFAVYKSAQTWKANRTESLKRHLEKHPEDAVAKAALNAIGTKDKPRRAEYRKSRVVIDGVPVRASDRLVREITRKVKAAARASVYRQKADAAEAAKQRKATAMKGK
ncbi:MAG: hypothetical protein ACRC9Y_10750 [Aeromonas veronii]